jgi:hypothetical protein
MLQGLGPTEPDRPQAYSVACPEGHVLRGHRTEGYQALRCPGCGEGVFILPCSPLPEPPAPSVDPARRRAAATLAAAAEDGPIPLTDPPPQPEGDDSEVDWLDPGSAAPQGPSLVGDPAELAFEEVVAATSEPVETARPRSRRPAQATRPATPRPRPERKRPEVVRDDRELGIVIPDRPGLIEQIRRKPVVPLVIGVMLLVVATVTLKLWKERKQNLPQIAEINQREGIEALERGDYSLAKDRLRKAANALAELRDDEAGKVRQAADEAAILADLVGEKLEDLIDTAAYKSEEWPDLFDRKYRGRSVLLDGTLQARRDHAPGFELDYRIVGDGKAPKIGWVDLADLAIFEGGAVKLGQKVTFGARLASITLDDRGEWRLRFEPESGVFMTNVKALKALPDWDEGAEDLP